MCDRCRSATRIVLREMFAAAAASILVEPAPDKLPAGHTYDAAAAASTSGLLAFLTTMHDRFTEARMADDASVDAVQAHLTGASSVQLKQCANLLYYLRELLEPLAGAITVELTDRAVSGDTFAADFVLRSPEGRALRNMAEAEENTPTLPQFMVEIARGVAGSGGRGPAPTPNVDYRH